MRKRTVNLTLVALLVLAGVLVTTGAAAPALKTTLDPPKLERPENHAVLSPGSLPIYFNWENVHNNRGYYLVIEKATLVGKNQIDWNTVIFYDCATGQIGKTFYASDLGGNGYYRWRMNTQAEYPLMDSKWSRWSTFTITGV